MHKFIWDTKLELGNSLIDRQHQYLFDLANQLMSVKKKNGLTIAFMRLYKHVREHFSDEEALMYTSDYPNYLEHQILHQNMLNELNETSTKICKENLSKKELESFIEKWIEHICLFDADFVKYIKLKNSTHHQEHSIRVVS